MSCFASPLYRHVVAHEDMNEGQRPTMEDAHVVYPDLSEALAASPPRGLKGAPSPSSLGAKAAGAAPAAARDARGPRPSALFALFDGHGGRDVVDFAAAAFGPNLAQLVADVDAGARADLTIERAVAAAYLLTDAQSHAQRHATSGTTAVSVLLRRDEPSGGVTLYAANAGDSRAVLCLCTLRRG